MTTLVKKSHRQAQAWFKPLTKPTTSKIASVDETPCTMSSKPTTSKIASVDGTPCTMSSKLTTMTQGSYEKKTPHDVFEGMFSF